MRCLFGFVCVLALAASPLRAGAEADGEGPISESDPGEAVSPAAPETEEPDIDTLSEKAIEHYESQAARVARTTPSVPGGSSVARHRRGLIASSVVFGAGIGTMVGAFALARTAECGDDDPATLDLCVPGGPIVLGTFAAGLLLGGLVGMAVSGSRLAKSRSKRRERARAHYGTPRRVHWDLAGSRLAF